MPDTTYLTNHLLIAMPSMVDPNFSQSVTYICEHTDDGAMGVIINRPLDITVNEVFAQLNLPAEQSGYNDMPVYSGGPIMQERGFVLHRPKGEWESSLPVTESIAITTSQDIIAAMANDIGPQDVLLALGYAGWGAGQLEQEMADNAWLTTPADENILFELPSPQRWKAAAQLIGIDPDQLSGASGHA